VLISGGIGVLAGAMEGAIVGSLLAPPEGAGALILAVALDRAVLLGVLSAAFGALIGAFDWYQKARRKRPAETRT
jgi:hypothetical protein